MIRNVGLADRRIRIVLGVIILALGVFMESWWGLIGLIPLATGFVRWCPLYAPFKFSTTKRETA
ncbi:MAG: DUF2892 domain-containing protein [Rhodothermales bacterium]